MEHPCTEMVADVNLPAAQLQVRVGGVSPPGGSDGLEGAGRWTDGGRVGLVEPKASGGTSLHRDGG